MPHFPAKSIQESIYNPFKLTMCHKKIPKRTKIFSFTLKVLSAQNSHVIFLGKRENKEKSCDAHCRYTHTHTVGMERT